MCVGGLGGREYRAAHLPLCGWIGLCHISWRHQLLRRLCRLLELAALESAAAGRHRGVVQTGGHWQGTGVGTGVGTGGGEVRRGEKFDQKENLGGVEEERGGGGARERGEGLEEVTGGMSRGWLVGLCAVKPPRDNLLEDVILCLDFGEGIGRIYFAYGYDGAVKGALAR